MQGLGLKAVELSAAVSSEYLGTRLLPIFGGTRSALQDSTVKAIDRRQLRPLPKTCQHTNVHRNIGTYVNTYIRTYIHTYIHTLCMHACIHRHAGEQLPTHQGCEMPQKKHPLFKQTEPYVRVVVTFCALS